MEELHILVSKAAFIADKVDLVYGVTIPQLKGRCQLNLW